MERKTRIWIGWLFAAFSVIAYSLVIFKLFYPSFGKAVLAVVVLGPITGIITTRIWPKDYKLFKKTL